MPSFLVLHCVRSFTLNDDTIRATPIPGGPPGRFAPSMPLLLGHLMVPAFFDFVRRLPSIAHVIRFAESDVWLCNRRSPAGGNRRTLRGASPSRNLGQIRTGGHHHSILFQRSSHGTAVSSKFRLQAPQHPDGAACIGRAVGRRPPEIPVHHARQGHQPEQARSYRPTESGSADRVRGGREESAWDAGFRPRGFATQWGRRTPHLWN